MILQVLRLSFENSGSIKYERKALMFDKKAPGVLAIKTGTPSIFSPLAIFSAATSHHKHCFHSGSVILHYDIACSFSLCLFVPITLERGSGENVLSTAKGFVCGFPHTDDVKCLLHH